MINGIVNQKSYSEGSVYCRLWDTEIKVIFDRGVTLDYAEKCVEAMNSMPPELIDAICRAAKLYCIEWCEDTDDDYVNELDMHVPVNADTPPAELLKCVRPITLGIDLPEDPSRIGYQLECNCDWEVEHGMEIDVLDNRLVYLSQFDGNSPWEDHSDDEWNYAARI